MTYTPFQLCERWQCSHSHVRNLIRSGELVAINIGTKGRSRYIVSAEALEAFETRRTVTPPAPAPKRRVRVNRGDIVEFFK